MPFLEWVRNFVISFLGLQPRLMLISLLKGTFDTLLLILLALGILTGGRHVMDSEYTLSRDVQTAVIRWAPVADHIAKEVDVPREVPLVLWFKESSMKAENPSLCTGIMGVYDLVRSGELPCFEPGPISDVEVAQQLELGAIEFKKRCPDVTYNTHNPDIIKRCYFAYNAGVGAATRSDPHTSAYVMNNYNESYTNMVYSDIELGTVTMTNMGAWPAHLAMSGLINTHWDESLAPSPYVLPDLAIRFYDWGTNQIELLEESSYVVYNNMEFPATRNLASQDCLAEPNSFGRLSLRPSLNPVTESPLLTQDVHGCSYSLPGVDITSENATAVLQAPMTGDLTTYTDRWQNTTIRIENDEWIIWLLHPRSYLVKEGRVKMGQPIGVMGAVGIATGPHVHYTIYNKVNETFVDPRSFLP